MVKKLLIHQWFGPLPEWFDLYAENVTRSLRPHGYSVHYDFDEQFFRERVRARLGIEYPKNADPRKPCSYRVTFGELYADLIDGFDFWGHTDLDVVFGRVHEFVTDEFLDGLDIHANHHDYLCGPWSLYRNTPVVNSLFRRHHGWETILESPSEGIGWAEQGYTEIMDAAHASGELRRAYTYWQTRNLDNFDSLHFDGDRLMEGENEVMMAHFRRTKIYPPRCRP